jgi:hypothetical protein
MAEKIDVPSFINGRAIFLVQSAKMARGSWFVDVKKCKKFAISGLM